MAKHFTHSITATSMQSNPMKADVSPHFTDEDSKCRESKNMPKVP